MRVIETSIAGAFLLEFEPVHDERGYFVRRFCREAFEQNALVSDFDFDSTSMNTSKHTLRGMHFQIQPFEETKLVSCTRGSIFDVIVDLRQNSNTRGKWFSVELAEGQSNALYVPPGCAHGFITLSDHTRVDYKLKGSYSPKHARGIRYNDPEISIQWPAEPSVISSRDRELPFLRELALQTI